jgi:hypothetical protein
MLTEVRELLTKAQVMQRPLGQRGHFEEEDKMNMSLRNG